MVLFSCSAQVHAVNTLPRLPGDALLERWLQAAYVGCIAQAAAPLHHMLAVLVRFGASSCRVRQREFLLNIPLLLLLLLLLLL